MPYQVTVSPSFESGSPPCSHSNRKRPSDRIPKWAGTLLYLFPQPGRGRFPFQSPLGQAVSLPAYIWHSGLRPSLVQGLHPPPATPRPLDQPPCFFFPRKRPVGAGLVPALYSSKSRHKRAPTAAANFTADPFPPNWEASDRFLSLDTVRLNHIMYPVPTLFICIRLTPKEARP